MCKAIPPTPIPSAQPIGPGIVPTTLFRQECLLAPQKEIQTEQESCNDLRLNLLCSSSRVRFCLVAGATKKRNGQFREPTEAARESHRRARSILICHRNTVTCQLHSQFCHPAVLALHVVVTFLAKLCPIYVQ